MKKKIKILIFFLGIFFFSAKGVIAYFPVDSGGGGGIMKTWEEAVYKEKNQFNLQSSINETFRNLVISANQAILGPENSDYRAMAGNGAIASVGNLIAGLYSNPPASSITYFADILHNLGLAKPVYAQGIGFSGMSNLLPLWKASRNLAYILFIVAFLYIGLAIMFRVKISPQAIVTIQSALPKLIIALILVTFSYAIVGLMIDLMYILIYLGVLAIGQTGWIENVPYEQARYTSLSFADGMGLIFSGEAKALIGILGGWFGGVAMTLALGIIGFALASTGWGAVAALLPVLIIGIIALFCIFKLFISLIGCYIGIIISLIVGPLQIMLGVIPGNEGGFGSWFKNLMANILVFPAVALAILIGWLLCGKHGPTWTPPVIAPSGGALTPIIGFGILLLLPKIPDIIKNAFKIKPAGYGAAIGQAFGPAKFPLRVGSSVAEAGAKQAEQAGTWLSGTPYRVVSELLGRASK